MSVLTELSIIVMVLCAAFIVGASMWKRWNR